MMGKIVSKQKFRTVIRPEIKKSGKTIALCHGVFDLVHPGHIIHLEQAKQMADVLVVSVTASEYVRKGPGRPYFSDEMRMKVLAALGVVDYVLLSEEYTVHDIVECVKPDIYVKGEEYAKEDDDITGKIAEERLLVEKYGGKIQFTSGQTYSSTKLINTEMAGLPSDVIRYMKEFQQVYSMHDIIRYADAAEKMKLLVIGDVIIDKYSYCGLQGLMSKDMGYSTRLDYSEEYFGGAVAIARHLSSFNQNVTLMSIVGNEESIREKFEKELSGKIRLEFSYSEIFPTIVKHRYLIKNSKREEYRKIFAINNMPPFMEYEETAKSLFKEKIAEKIKEYDAVFLCDFGHGLIDKEIRDIVEREAKYLILNCQTNSANHGMNIITKYNRADVFALDQEELRLAYPMYASDEKNALRQLTRHLNGNGWLTRGSLGAYGIENDEIFECPAFILTVKDTVGAGDAFYSIAGLYTAAGASIELGTFMGNIAGALGANIVGNREAVEKVNILKYASTLMNV